MGINLTNAQSFRELIDDDMTKELEEFRRNAGKNNSCVIKNNSPTCVKKHSEDNLTSPLTKSQNNDDKGVFAEAMLNLSSYVKTSCDPIDLVLNPFAKKQDSGNKNDTKDLKAFLPSYGNKDSKKDALPKKLGKFNKDKAEKESTGFSLSRFWKKK